MKKRKQTLNNYIRIKVWHKFVKLVKKNKCEQCGGIEDLQVHHIYPFANMVKDTLVELGLEEYETIDNYTKLELKNIEEKVLGKHLFYTYKTLCIHCHLSVIHRKHKHIKIDLSIEDNLLNKWITRDIIFNDIIIKNNLRDNRNRLIGLPTLEKILKEHGYDLKRKKKGKRKITHYMIKKLE